MAQGIKQVKCTSEERVYNFIVDFIKNNGFPPSVREISAGCGLKSTSTVYDYLEVLEMVGKIEIKRKTTRGIRVAGYTFVKMEELA